MTATSAGLLAMTLSFAVMVAVATWYVAPWLKLTDWTTGLTGGFKATLALFAWQAEKLRPSFLLIDATQFRHQFGPGVMQWRDDFIMPRYGAAGVRKFAFHVPTGFPNAMEAGGKEVIEGLRPCLRWSAARQVPACLDLGRERWFPRQYSQPEHTCECSLARASIRRQVATRTIIA
jgi:hypothetical protein